MWLYSDTSTLDLQINKALNRAKRAIMGENRDKLITKVDINAAGQMAIRADLLAEEVFLNSLIHEGLTGILYSEESGVKEFGKKPLDENSIILLLDPLDGSQNYKKGLPFGCISVAYGQYHKNATLSSLSRGAILNLYSEDLIFGVKDSGAWYNGEELNSSDNNNRPISQISFYAYGELAKRYFFDFQEKYSLRSLGSAAWELVLTAIGSNDAYIDLRGVLRAHDFMAAKIIIEAIDGHFVNLSEIPIDEQPLDDFRQGYPIISSMNSNHINLVLSDMQENGLLK